MTRTKQVLLVSVLSVAAAVFIVTVPAFRHFFDLGVYRGAVRWWLIDGGDLYDFHYQGTEYGFTYPPFAALVFAPLAALPWHVAIVASVAVNAAAVAILLRWFFRPIVQRTGWPAWTAGALAFLAVLLFGPAEDTFSFGQVNLVLLILVLADLRALKTGRWPGFWAADKGRTAIYQRWPDTGFGQLVAVGGSRSTTAVRNHPPVTVTPPPAEPAGWGAIADGRWAGVGIGLAAAIKLTPAVFIGYLILTRRYKAAAVACGTAAAATLFALLVAPGPSKEFWTSALWDTNRVGKLEYVSNQSLRGVVARLDASAVWWLVLVTVVVAYWAWWLWFRRPGLTEGFVSTGLVACLISPVTWVHHLVWVLPALFLLLDRAVSERLDWRRLTALGLTYALLSSSVVWLWWNTPPGMVAFVGSNAFVWTTIGLLVVLTRRPDEFSLRPAGRLRNDPVSRR